MNTLWQTAAHPESSSLAKRPCLAGQCKDEADGGGPRWGTPAAIKIRLRSSPSEMVERPSSMTASPAQPSKEELFRAHSELADWQKPDEFLAKVTALGNWVETSKLWGNNAKFLREAMVLAEYAKLRDDLDFVRLGEDPPDGWLRSTEDVPVEITEVIEPGRKRGDEYREDKIDQPEMVEDLQARIERIEPSLENVIRAKVGKYANNPMLLVYLDIVDHGRAQKDIELVIANQKAEYGNSFREVCVIWKAKLY